MAEKMGPCTSWLQGVCVVLGKGGRKSGCLAFTFLFAFYLCIQAQMMLTYTPIRSMSTLHALLWELYVFLHGVDTSTGWGGYASRSSSGVKCRTKRDAVTRWRFCWGLYEKGYAAYCALSPSQARPAYHILCTEVLCCQARTAISSWRIITR